MVISLISIGAGIQQSFCDVHCSDVGQSSPSCLIFAIHICTAGKKSSNNTGMGVMSGDLQWRFRLIYIPGVIRPVDDSWNCGTMINLVLVSITCINF